MKKQRSLYIVLFLLLLIVSIVATVACTDPKLNDTEVEGETAPAVKYEQAVSNGTFYSSYNTTGKNYLKSTVDNWTATKGQTAVSSVTFGAIDTAEEAWTSGIGTISSNLTYPGIAPNSPKKTDGTLQDSYAAVVAYTTEVGSAYYLSSAITAEKGKTYKLTIDVATFVLNSAGGIMTAGETEADGKGAYIFVTGGFYNVTQAINTEGEWDTVTVYLEGNDTADTTFNVQLWLGHASNYVNGGKTNTRLTRGVMLFDNVILTECEQTAFDAATVSDGLDNTTYVNGATVHKYSTKYFEDTDFAYNSAYTSYSTSSTASSTKAYYSAKVGTPYKYTRVMGKDGLTADYPTTYSNSYYYPDGIFDLSKIYSYAAAGNTFTDTFAAINTTEWNAPNWEDFYTSTGAYDNNSYNAYLASVGANLKQSDNNTRVLAIYNKSESALGFKSNSKMTMSAGKYYSVTSYAYLYKALTLPNAATSGLTLEQANANIEALNAYVNQDVTAKIKLTGVTFSGSGNAGYGTKTATFDVSAAFGSATDLDAVYESYDDNGTTKYKVKTTYGYTVDTAFDAYSVGDFIATATYDALSAENKAKCSYGTAENYLDAYGKWVSALGEWQEITYKIQANTLSSRSVGIEFWLGEGTADDSYPDLQKGGVLFDGINILESDAADATFDVLSSASQAAPFVELSAIDISTGYDMYSLAALSGTNANFLNLDGNGKYDVLADDVSGDYGYKFSYVDGVNNTANSAFAAVISPDVTESGWTANETLNAIGEYPQFTSVYDSNAAADYTFGMLVLQHKSFTASTLTLNDVNSVGYAKLAAIYPNKYYRLGVMVKTENMSTDAAATLALILRNTASDKTTVNTLTSFTAISTDGIWTEYVFYIKGAQIANVRDEGGLLLDHNRVGLQLSFGSGDAYNTSTHTKGTVYLTGITFGAVAYSEYTGATAGNTLKKQEFSASTYTSNTTTNGRFTNVDYDKTIAAAEKTVVGYINTTDAEVDGIAAYSFRIGGSNYYFNGAMPAENTVYSDAIHSVAVTDYTIDLAANRVVLSRYTDVDLTIKDGKLFATTAYDELGNLIAFGEYSDGWSTTAYTYDKLATPAVENKTVYVTDPISGAEKKAIDFFAIRWKKVDGAAKYEIYFNADGDADNKYKVIAAAPVDGSALYEHSTDGYVYYKIPNGNAGTYYVRAVPDDLTLKTVSEYGSVTAASKFNTVTSMPDGQGYSASVFAAAPVASTAAKYVDPATPEGSVLATKVTTSINSTDFNGTVADSITLKWAQVSSVVGFKYEIYYNPTSTLFTDANTILIYTGAPTVRATVADVTANDTFVVVNDASVYYKLPSAKLGNYFVRVIPASGTTYSASPVSDAIDFATDMYAVPANQMVNNSVWNDVAIASDVAVFTPAENKTSFRGIIDYINFDSILAGMGDVDNAIDIAVLGFTLYADTTSAAGASSDGYFTFGSSTNKLYNNAMMLYSDVATYGGYTMASTQTLTAESYYYVSVWVYTMPGTKASVTLDVSSKVYDNTNGFDGYYNIDTQGKWVEYRFMAKVGVSSATVKLGLFMGRKYVDGTTTKYDYSKGYVFFDDITVKTLTEEQYNAFMKKEDGTALNEWTYDTATNAEANIYSYDVIANDALDTVFYNNSFAFVALDYVTDSFDTAGTTLSTSDTALGYTPSDYTHGMATSSVNDTGARSYGVYKAAELSEEKHSVFYTELSEYAWFNASISDLASAKNYLAGWGKNTLMMVNYVDNGQYYQSNTRTLAANTNYVISFYAKALLPEGAYAEFRFVHGNDTAKFDTVKIYGGGDQGNGFAKYEMYVSNPTSASVSASYFTFNLGTYDATKATKEFVKGMLVVDNVTMKTVTEAEYTAAKTSYDNTADDNKATSRLNYYAFTTATTPNEEENTTENTETNGSTIDSQTWLIISSAVIGAMILIAVVVVMIRQFKKKYVKVKVVGENKLDSAKKDELTIKQQNSTAHVRETIDRDEFND